MAATVALCFSSAILAQPANDDCAGAIAVVDGMNGPYTNVGATDSPEPWPCGGTASADIWFVYTATFSGMATAQTCGGDFDTKIEIFSGTCGALTSLGCNDDACSLQSSLNWSVAMGTAYYIRVGGFSGATGNFPLDISPALTNDDCTGAVAVMEGMNGPFSNVGATPAAAIAGTFSCVNGGGGADIWFSYTPTLPGLVTARTCGADYDSCIEAYDGSCGALNSLACNDDFCTLQSQISFPASAGTTYYIKVGGFAATTGNFPLEIINEYGVDLEGVAETTPGSGTLGPVGGAFMAGDTWRWNYLDPAGNAAGKFAAVVGNFGIGGPPPLGVTPAIPGFVQLSSISMPPGFEVVFPPRLLPAPDEAITIPAGIFSPGDSFRLQGLVLDPPRALGTLPVVATRNTIEFLATGPCMASEGFEGWTAGGPPYMNGWTDGGGTLQWLVDSNGTTSGGTGPSAAIEGVNYMYCETSVPATTGDTWILNSAVFPSAGLSALAFQLSRVGDGIGTLEVRMGDGSGTFPTLLRTYAGMSPVEWTQEVIALGGGLPTNVQFQFHYTYGGSFRGDIAIDDFCLQ